MDFESLFIVAAPKEDFSCTMSLFSKKWKKEHSDFAERFEPPLISSQSIGSLEYKEEIRKENPDLRVLRTYFQNRLKALQPTLLTIILSQYSPSKRKGHSEGREYFPWDVSSFEESEGYLSIGYLPQELQQRESPFFVQDYQLTMFYGYLASLFMRISFEGLARKNNPHQYKRIEEILRVESFFRDYTLFSSKELASLLREKIG